MKESSARFNRSRRIAALLSIALLPGVAAAVEMQRVQVYKTASCGCCGQWVDHMKASGFSVEVQDVRDVMPFRERLGVPDAVTSCHTALVGGYVIEGHVPAADVKRLLRERPTALGIAVPGMVQGTPGMEQGRPREHYNVMLFNASGAQKVFTRY